MSLVVETGYGVPEADAYCSVEQCDAYHQKMGHAGWPSSDSTPDIVGAKEVAIRQATSYIDTRFAVYLRGTRTNPEQGLEWPRVYCNYYSGEPIDSHTVPTCIVKAAMEMALIAYEKKPLYTDVQQGPLLTSKSIAGVISKTWDVSTYGNQPVFGIVNSLLFPVFGPLSTNTASLNVVSLFRGV